VSLTDNLHSVEKATAPNVARRVIVAADIPFVVKRAVIECKTPLRLLYFIPAFHRSRKGVGLTITGGALFSVTDAEDEELEHKLTRTQVLESIANWLDILHAVHPEHVLTWRTMLQEEVFNMSTQAHTWEEQLEYILLLRSNAAPHAVGPPIWNWDDLWTIAKREASARARAVQEQAQADLLQQFTAFASASQLAPTTPFSGSSFRKPSTKQETKNKTSSSSGVGFTPRYPKLSDANAAQAQLNCFVCGMVGDHHWKQCEASVQVNGTSLRVKKNHGGNYIWHTGQSVCYNWNGTRGCDDKQCSHGSHLCTLCQAPDHGAFKCSSK
jgi:hypothetical protein